MSFWLMTCKTGYLYSKEWPQMAELNAVFAENKVIRLTTLAQKACPVVAVCGAWVQYSQLGAAHLPMILTLMLAILSMPLQGFYWLGKRADSQLPPSLSGWYHEVRQKMQESGLEPKALQGQPRYMDLARLLKQAVAQLDNTFIRQWF